MILRVAKFLSPLLMACAAIAAAEEGNLEAEVGFEARGWIHEGGQKQERSNLSVRIEAEYYTEWNDGDDSFTFSPFLRLDQRDAERTHGDIRELTWVHVGSDWELRTGVRRVFWGVTETQHMVDIINQTDAVENLDGEDKLGQFMINLSLVKDWGIVDVFVLPGFRERTFAGKDGRLRSPYVIDTNHAEYESGAEENRVDFAVRWAHSIDDFELAVSHFSGTSRDPSFQLSARSFTNVTGLGPVPDELIPVYETIDQTGLEAQYIYEDWLWKLEAISNSGYSDDRYSAAVFGFEYTAIGIFETRSDLGYVVEYHFDDRGEDSSADVLESDLALALRWTANDEDSTEVLTGITWDSDDEEKMYFLEASTRVAQEWKLEVEARFWFGRDSLSQDFATAVQVLSNPSAFSRQAYFQDEDYVQVELTRYF